MLCSKVRIAFLRSCAAFINLNESAFKMRVLSVCGFVSCKWTTKSSCGRGGGGGGNKAEVKSFHCVRLCTAAFTAPGKWNGNRPAASTRP